MALRPRQDPQERRKRRSKLASLKDTAKFATGGFGRERKRMEKEIGVKAAAASIAKSAKTGKTLNPGSVAVLTTKEKGKKKRVDDVSARGHRSTRKAKKAKKY